MTMIYSNPARENENDGALPDVEVFHRDSCFVRFGLHGDCGRTYDTCPHVGWYWQACMPGCLPDGEPNGPFDTEAEAIEDAQSDAWDDPGELPPCAVAMRCYCAGHARGNPASAPCDTSEQPDDDAPEPCKTCGKIAHESWCDAGDDEPEHDERQSRPATRVEYAPLLKELESIGYQLVVRQRIGRAR